MRSSTTIYHIRFKYFICNLSLYAIFSWLLFFFFNIVLAACGNPTLSELAALLFLSTLSFILADVCTEYVFRVSLLFPSKFSLTKFISFKISAMIVERSKKYENETSRGSLQAFGYIVRFFGAIFGTLFGSIFYNKENWGWGLPIYGPI